MIEEIKKQIKNLLQDVSFKTGVDLEIPANQEMGDLALPCFDIAKRDGKDPKKVAEEVCEKFKRLKDCQIVDKCEALGPYVNFYLNTSELAKVMGNNLQKVKDYGVNSIGKGKKVLVEYPSQNTHKEFHIGHLRNVCIGNTIVQLYRKSGYKIIPINYVNDFGRHVVKCLWGMNKFYKDKEPGENKQKWLGEVYAKASNYIKEHEDEVKPELDELQKRLEEREGKIWELFEKTREWSNEGFKNILEELSVEHDSIIYESEVKDRGQELVDELLKKGIAEVGEGGAIIIDLEKYKLGIALLRKSTSAGVYLTSDLALAERKFEKYDVDESINITGSEQDFYFKQLFKVLELLDFGFKMTHVGYGLVNLPSGKMSSRSGEVILYEDLRDQIMEHMNKETVDRHEDWSEEKIKDVVKKLTMAILKFTMQKHEANKNITFDFKEAVSFEGYSAPYILYVVARINSILRKAKVKEHKFSINYGIINKIEEKGLLLLVSRYPEIIKKALLSYNPSTIARYCFDLAKSFNDYYNKYSILNNDDEELTRVRLAFCGTIKYVLEDALKLLTIETVEEM